MLCNIPEGRKSRLRRAVTVKLRKTGHITSNLLSSTLLSNQQRKSLDVEDDKDDDSDYDTNLL
jgi:hypothetical protein